MIGVIEWVLDHSEATGGARLVLIVLAEHAHADGGEAFPSVDTIAHRTRMSRRGVQENLRRLEAEGHIARDGVSRKGTTVYRVLMGQGGGADRAPRADRAPAQNGAEGGAPRAPEPPVEPSSGGTSGARASDDDPKNRVPDDFPAELRPHAREVMRLLRRVADDHGAKRVWPLAVARVVASHPRHPLVATAAELEAWAVDPPRPIRDVVATYRTFLKRAAELEATERLADDGTPTAQRPRPLAAVASINGRRGGRNRPVMAKPSDFAHLFEGGEAVRP